MLGDRAHDVVGYSRRHSPAHKGGVAQQGVQTTLASIVQVDVHAAVVGEDEIANGVGALDVVFVACKGAEEPGVFFGDKVEGRVVGPQNILVVGVEVYT